MEPAILLLSSGFASLIQSFAPLFDSCVWSYAQLLLLGAILVPGKRTVTAVPVAAHYVSHWYGVGPRTIQVATGTAVWYRVSLPVVPLRWVLIRDPQQQFRSRCCYART